MLYSSPFKFVPSINEKVFLCIGQAIFGTSSADPVIPLDKTISNLCGQAFWQAYHSFLLSKLKMAICLSLYLIQPPQLLGKSLTVPALNQTVTLAAKTVVYLSNMFSMILLLNF